MTDYVSEARTRFYDHLWWRAVSHSDWCQVTTGNLGAEKVTALVPRGYVAPEWIEKWPTLAEDGPHSEPGWVPTPAKIQVAVDAILRGQALTMGHHGDQVARRRLALAVQHVNADELPPWLCDRILQIAVFGQVVFE